MAQQVYDLPCDGEGICMACKNKPTAEESLTCKTCATPWHVTCLSVRPSSLADTLQWDCPDCSLLSANAVPVSDAGESSSSGGLIAAICAIESDSSLTDREKAKRRQRLLCKDAGPSEHKEVTNSDNNLFSILDGLLNCSFCMQLLERPVSNSCTFLFSKHNIPSNTQPQGCHLCYIDLPIFPSGCFISLGEFYIPGPHEFSVWELGDYANAGTWSLKHKVYFRDILPEYTIFKMKGVELPWPMKFIAFHPKDGDVVFL